MQFYQQLTRRTDMGIRKKVKPDPLKHFILGRSCPDCIESDHVHDGHIQAYLHEPDDADKNARRLVVFRSIADAKLYLEEHFDEEESQEITILPMSEATFGEDSWGDSDG